MQTKLLIVEDEDDLASLIADYARSAGFEPQICKNGEIALVLLRQQIFDLLILDLMLPGLDGISLCRELRTFSDTPVIMVTAKVEEIDRLLGLEIGADDYLCKPFSPRELIARCKTILKRRPAQTAQHANSSRASQLRIDSGSYQIYLQDVALELTRSEYLILKYLAEHPSHVFSRAQLLDIAGEDKLNVTDRAVDSHIKNLRKKIQMIAVDAHPIHSIYGLGYRYDGFE